MHAEQTEDFRRWVSTLRDRAARSRVLVRIERLVHGNPGACRHLKGGVSELKIDAGPGYRVYYSVRNGRLRLLTGGDKSTQAKDIARALKLARNLEV